MSCGALRVRGRAAKVAMKRWETTVWTSGRERWPTPLAHVLGCSSVRQCGRSGGTADRGAVEKWRAAVRAAGGLGRVLEARKKLFDKQHRRLLYGGLAKGRPCRVQARALALAVQAVAAKDLQPWNGNVREVAREERLGAEIQGHCFSTGVVLVAVRAIAKAYGVL